MREILSPFEFTCWQLAGYSVFALAGIVIPFAIAQCIRELRPRKLKRPSRSAVNLRRPIPFPKRAAGRVLVFPSRATRKAPYA